MPKCQSERGDHGSHLAGIIIRVKISFHEQERFRRVQKGGQSSRVADATVHGVAIISPTTATTKRQDGQNPWCWVSFGRESQLVRRTQVNRFRVQIRI